MDTPDPLTPEEELELAAARLAHPTGAAALSEELGHLSGDPGLLTPAEHELIDLLGQCASSYLAVVGSHVGNRFQDNVEFVAHIHDLQARVMAQAAARAYPSRYRLAGGPPPPAPPAQPEGPNP